MKIGFAFLPLYLLLICYTSKVTGQTTAADSVSVRKILDLSEAVRKVYAPDKRTAIFQVLKDSAGNHFFETTETEAAKKLADTLNSEGIKIPVPIKILPAKELGNKQYALVNVSVGNIRSDPRNAAELGTQTLLGTPLDILKKEGYYYLVRTPDGYISWLDAGAIASKTSAEMQTWKLGDKVVFIADYGHAFEKPNLKSQRISDLVMGDVLIKASSQRDFVKVIYPDGREGFIPQNQVTNFNEWAKKPVPNSSQVIEVAKTMIGVPYLWGGTSVKGVDCSGFTKTAFFMNGVVIPRDASQQVLVGEPVVVLKNGALDLPEALKNLKPGDLIFFAGGKNRPANARVTHVAMYLGDGEFIHSAGQVRINSMKPEAINYDDFETRTVVAARRYIGNIGTAGITAILKHPAYIQK